MNDSSVAEFLKNQEEQRKRTAADALRNQKFKKMREDISKNTVRSGDPVINNTNNNVKKPYEQVPLPPGATIINPDGSRTPVKTTTEQWKNYMKGKTKPPEPIHPHDPAYMSYTKYHDLRFTRGYSVDRDDYNNYLKVHGFINATPTPHEQHRGNLHRDKSGATSLNRGIDIHTHQKYTGGNVKKNLPPASKPTPPQPQPKETPMHHTPHLIHHNSANNGNVPHVSDSDYKNKTISPLFDDGKTHSYSEQINIINEQENKARKALPQSFSHPHTETMTKEQKKQYYNYVFAGVKPSIYLGFSLPKYGNDYGGGPSKETIKLGQGVGDAGTAVM